MTPGLEALHLRLDQFEGPLSLLLHLIERNELEITSVSVVEVADQFMQLTRGLDPLELATTGEFVAAAARLLLIKSRALLYRRKEPGEETADEDDAEVLARQIAEYAKFKRAAVAIDAMLNGDFVTCVRPPAHGLEMPSHRPSVRLELLLRAARRLLAETPAGEQTPGPWSDIRYADVKAALLAEMERLGSASFAMLMRPAQHPLTIVTLFLALLDAVRAQQLCMDQQEPFGAILVSLANTSCVDA